MNGFLTGAVLSAPDERDWLFHESKLVSARSVFGAGSVDWRPLWTPRVQAANDCVAFDTVQKIWLRSQLSDPTPLPWLSALFLWQQAVRLQGNGVFDDVGTQHRFVLKVARDSGLVAESAWAEKPENIWLVPPADLIESGLLATLEAFYRIPDGATCKLKGLPMPDVQIAEAMRRGYPVGCVMKVNRAFGELGSKAWTGPIDDPVGEGYHAQTILVNNEPDRLFGLASSWGADTGDEGVYWLTKDSLNEHTAEFWVVTHVPENL